jgi:hypothetical protein
MIRPAKHVDIPQIITLLKEGYNRCKYASEAQIDETFAKQMLSRMVMLHGGHGETGVCHFVADDGVQIVGNIVGHKNRIGEIGNKFYTSDSLFYVAQGASPFVHVGLLKAFLKWSAEDARVIRVIPGVSDMIQPYDIAAQIYESMGFTRMGVILERGIKRSESEAA